MHKTSDVYDLESVELPYLAGRTLRLFTALLEGPFGGLMMGSLLKTGGLTWFRQQRFDGPPTLKPLHLTRAPSAETPTMDPAAWPAPASSTAEGLPFRTVGDYAAAYRAGRVTPVEIAERVLTAVAESNAASPPLRAIIAVDREDVVHQAEAATRRLEAGEPLSALDGVPVAIKDEFDMRPYPTTVGTAFLGTEPAAEDATVVARMRDAGALLIGKANMTEIGLGVSGLNLIHGTPRNPYAPDHYTGGSSSGPATAVAAGLCPIALGADGGGSIRIPASFCGLTGLKATYGRVSEHGAAPLTWSMGHIGPLAASATDTALAYAAIAGADPKDATSLLQPPPALTGWNREDLSDLTLGIYPPWFEHAADGVVAACRAVVAAFEDRGAQVREVIIPGLEAARIAHTITITAEMSAALADVWKDHYSEHGLDVRVSMALAKTFLASDYVQAQRVRTQLMAAFDDAFQDADVIVTPATAVTAPPIPDAALRGNESDLSTLIEIMRFATPANLTGLPAIAFPAGTTAEGLPIGCQAIGRAWEEPMLLRLARVAEGIVKRQKPTWYYDLLTETSSAGDGAR